MAQWWRSTESKIHREAVGNILTLRMKHTLRSIVPVDSVDSYRNLKSENHNLKKNRIVSLILANVHYLSGIPSQQARHFTHAAAMLVMLSIP